MTIANGIKRVRFKLAESQAGMARRLGCSVSGYAKWERGVSVPLGDVILKIVQMSPDPETLAAFGIIWPDNDSRSSPVEIEPKWNVRGRKSNADAQELSYLTGLTRSVFESLCRAVESGNMNAREFLRETYNWLASARDADWNTRGAVKGRSAERKRNVARRA
jgi:transcriptional regulator with XRE-family HTH domain